MRLLLLLAALLTPLTAGALEKVVLQLKWKHQFQFAGYYAALEKGFFREAGLDVSIVEAGPSTDPVREVLDGRAQFGVSNSALILARARGEPVVALAVIFQHSPFILIARRNGDIRTVHDLVGKRLMIEPHAEEIFAYLRKEGVSEKLLRIQPHSFDHQDLVDGRTDVLTAYSTDDPYLFDQKKFPYLEFSPRAAGIDFYGDNLFTSVGEIARQPERVKAFRDASLRGWNYAMQHQDEIVELILARYGKRKSREHLRFEATEMLRLVRTDLIEIGHMHPGRWRHIADTYADLGMLPRDFPLDGFLYDPAPRPDRRMTVAAAASAGLALVLGAIVVGFLALNRKLRREIAARKQTEVVMLARGAAIEAAAEGVAITDPDGVIEYVNPALIRNTGYTKEELVGRHTRIFSSGCHDKAFYENLWNTICSGNIWRGEIVNRRKNGSQFTELMAIAPVCNERGETVHYVALKHDISDRKRMEDDLKQTNAMLEAQLAEIHRLQEELRELAVRDGLTNLFNRRYLDETLERELARAKREGYPLSLVMIDIDHFKKLNDTYGHQAGDKVLRELAALLWSNVRTGDVPCRYGGEEFVVLLPRMPLEVALDRAEDWRNTFRTMRVPFGDFQLETTISCGLSAYPEHARTPDELVRCCDEALYRAKRGGRNRSEIFRPDQTDVR